MRALREIATLSWKELLVLARDRQATVLLFGMPAVFVFILSLALEKFHGEKVGVELGLVLEVEDGGDFAKRIGDALRAAREFRLVERPAGVANEPLFQQGLAQAAVRIPAGFSEDLAAFLASEGHGDFGPHRIEWQASPALDASFRSLLQARLAVTLMGMVQEELERRQAELGRELTELGARLERMGAELDELGAELEATGAELERTGKELEEKGALLASTAAELARTVRLLESAAELLAGSPAELEAAAVAAMREQAAQAEAAAMRLALARRGELPEGVLVEEPAPPALDFEPPPPVERRARGRRAPEPVVGPLEGAGEPPRVETAPGPVSDAGPPLRADGAELFLAETRGARDVLPTPLQQTVPGWSLFAMFFLLVPLSQGLHRERADGTLRRILGLGVGKGALVLGKLLPYVLVGSLQFAGMLLVGLFVLPLVSKLSLELGPRPWMLVPITLASALAATSFGLLVASLTRTFEQAAAAGATAVIVLSVISGVMVPHFLMPSSLQRLALASPLYWGHEAYLDYLVHGARLPEVAPGLGVLLGFSAACLAVAARRVVSTRG